jgi:hypothetical protein
LRILISLFKHLTTTSDESASLLDLVGATALPKAEVTAALEALAAHGYVEHHNTGTGAPGPTMAPAASELPPAQAPAQAPGLLSAAAATVDPTLITGKTPAKGGTLNAGIMDYDLDIDHLIRAGDANIRDGRGAGAGGRPENGDDSAGIIGWNPLTGEESRPVALRFMVWLRFVLGTEELEACDRFALSHKEEWSDWIDRFGAARAAGEDDGLLEDIRTRIKEGDTSGPSVPPSAGGGSGQHRHH